MLKRILTYFVLMLIASQSALATGGAHQLHQSGSEHSVLDDNHLHSIGHHTDAHHNHTLDSESPTAETSDCNHCCQCHGHLCPAVLISIEQVNLLKHASSVPEYAESSIPETYETFLRPPIA